jgi:hypothetical protein
MSIKQDIIGEYQSTILSTIGIYQKNNTENAKKLWEFLPDMPIGFIVNSSTFGDLWITYPYNKSLIKRIKKSFKDNGWIIHTQVREADVKSEGIHMRNPRITFRHKKTNWDYLDVIIEFSDAIEGATCKREVIGTETKELDIVEFVCK